MIEVEMKLPVKERASVELQLLELGFCRGDLVKESDTYFNSKEWDIRKRGEALRIRRIDNQTTGKDSSVITFKGRKSDSVSMTRKELETGVGNPDICEEIFLSVGLEPMRPVVKLRQYYYRDRMTACLDQVEGLGDFLELEILVTKESEKEEALGEIESTLGRLGYRVEDTTRTSYLTMLQRSDGEREKRDERLCGNLSMR